MPEESPRSEYLLSWSLSPFLENAFSLPSFRKAFLLSLNVSWYLQKPFCYPSSEEDSIQAIKYHPVLLAASCYSYQSACNLLIRIFIYTFCSMGIDLWNSSYLEFSVTLNKIALHFSSVLSNSETYGNTEMMSKRIILVYSSLWYTSSCSLFLIVNLSDSPLERYYLCFLHLEHVYSVITIYFSRINLELHKCEKIIKSIKNKLSITF